MKQKKKNKVSKYVYEGDVCIEIIGNHQTIKPGLGSPTSQVKYSLALVFTSNFVGAQPCSLTI